MLKVWGDTGVACIQEQKLPTGEIVDVPTLKCLEAIFVIILRIAVPLAVLALLVMLLIGGFRYLTSAGDQKAMASGKQTITYALIGVVLMVLAYLIFTLIGSYTGLGDKIFKFEIPTVPTPPP